MTVALKALDHAEWNEIRYLAEQLKGLGSDAREVLRRAIRGAQEPEVEVEPGLGPDFRSKEILDALGWLAASEAKRTVRPPALLPLSESEATTVRAALRAQATGINVASTLATVQVAEKSVQQPEDLRAGRLLDYDAIRFPELLKDNSVALMSPRIAQRFLVWLKYEADEGQRAQALRWLKKRHEVNREDVERRSLAFYVSRRIRAARVAGMTKGDALSAEAQGLPLPVGVADVKPRHPATPATVSELKKLLGLVEGVRAGQRTLKAHKRPGRSKHKTPGK